jgi:tetrahydromethanopterin S-methyltransferase subunit G
MDIEAIQADNANQIPLRASQQRIGTLVIRFIGLLFLAVTALALVWIR